MCHLSCSVNLGRSQAAYEIHEPSALRTYWMEGLCRFKALKVAAFFLITLSLSFALSACSSADNDADSSSESRDEAVTSTDAGIKKAAYAAYADRLGQYVDEYGSPAVDDTYDSYGWHTEVARGVCLAELVDFDGDGLEELLVAYYDDAKDDPYQVEIWTYNGSEAMAVHTQEAEMEEGGTATFTRAEFAQDAAEEGRQGSWIVYTEYGRWGYWELRSVSTSGTLTEHTLEWIGAAIDDMAAYLDGEKQTPANSDPLSIPSVIESCGAHAISYAFCGWSENNDSSYATTSHGRDIDYSPRACVGLARETMATLGLVVDDTDVEDDSEEDGDLLIGVDEEVPEGGYVLTGNVRVHVEDVRGNQVTVVSMTLEDPIDYKWTYRGTESDMTAHEVELESSSSQTYGQWAAYEGQRIEVWCESLSAAYHDGSLHGVDSFAGGEIRLLSE